jgi:hypothetical protein
MGAHPAAGTDRSGVERRTAVNIYLIRHGESRGNVDASHYGDVADHAIPVSDKGREQARGVGMALRDYLDARKKWPTSDAKPLGYHLRMWVSPYVSFRTGSPFAPSS